MTVYAVAESVPDIMPCRKCGAVGILRRSSDGDVEWVRCEVCGHEGATRYTTFGAITEWNRCARIDEPTPTQAVSQETAVEAALLSVLDAVQDYLPPDGISKDECLNRVIGAIDNPTINPVLAAIKKSALTPGSREE